MRKARFVRYVTSTNRTAGAGFGAEVELTAASNTVGHHPFRLQEVQQMRWLAVSGYAFNVFIAALLAACGGSQPSIGVPGAMPQSHRTAAQGSGTESVLFDFYQSTGAVPEAPVIFDSEGAIYGTTYLGGNYACYQGEGGCGTLFKLTPSQSGYWDESFLYGFCQKAGCGDGALPVAGLIFDSRGSLYGTTTSGGSANGGTVFKLTRSRSGVSESVLYSFCQASNCNDGETPKAGLIFDKRGALYGTTQNGGAYGAGAVFKLSRSHSGYTESVLYSFCKRSGCSDGAEPLAGLIFDAKGAIYGTTVTGGGPGCYPYSEAHSGCGTVFRLKRSRSRYVESVLYAFCRAPHCTDGAEPAAGVIFDRKGALYGTTRQGGTYKCDYGEPGCGTVFRLTPSRSGYTESVLYAFCIVKPECSDGSYPEGGLVFDKNRTLYGTTEFGGGNDGGGTVFDLTPSASRYKERVLYTFSGANDDSWPAATPVFGTDGALYGTSEGHSIVHTGAVWRVERAR
jgi:uncharacterized repeat protein (TIGR03803 family)